MNPAIVIPSRDLRNLEPCVRAIQECDPGLEVIVVDDGLVLESGPEEPKVPKVLSGCRIVPGIKPFCFARNVNLGILAAGRSDVVLLNDDALLKTPGGFTLLAGQAQENPEFGVISAATNVSGNIAQLPRGIGLRPEPRTLAFVCALIPRRTIDAIGLLDERFTAYGWEDNDYCRRTRNAGLKLGIFDGCFVDHGSLRSTFRGLPHAPGSIAAGRDIYIQKWGDVN